MAKLRLTMACWDYDRTRALMEDRIPLDGIELTDLNLPVEETFFRMLRHQEFDIAELSLSSYTLSLFQEHPPVIAIPVFPSRCFRHSCIFVNRHAGIEKPKDLVGKRVGNPQYQMTATVWIRGILSDEYQVPVTSVRYFTGGEEEAGRPEKLPLSLPAEICIQPIAATQTLSRALETGEIDALYTARTPSTFCNATGRVRRLFSNYHTVEKEYFGRTRIFPIMHTIAIYERHPWVAQSLYKAFLKARRKVYEDLVETAALKFMLPWLQEYVEQTRQIMDPDFWPYGLQPNLSTLGTFLGYHHEQVLSHRQLMPQELFAPETLESFKI
jgi:4,5-dihydroxyphthalate decarboxylase